MQFCPRCGAALEPGKKFCTNCGASLAPDLPGPGPEVHNIPPSGSSGIRPAGALIAVAGLIVIILVVLVIGYPALKGMGLLAAGGSPVTQPSPTSDSGSGSAKGGSRVEVITVEQTLLPTTVPVPASTTFIPTITITTLPTEVPTTKPIICPSDRVKCDNTCADLRTDSKNCGFCGTVCPGGKFCLNGQCMQTCSSGQTSCPDGCFNLQSHARHCGSCLNSCPLGLICYNGQCTAPATPMIVPQ